MSEYMHAADRGDAAPGDDHGQILPSLWGYMVGLGLALGLTVTSFWVTSTHVLWSPGVAIGLCVLAIAQMGVHLVFFLHISTAPDQTNNFLSLIHI